MVPEMAWTARLRRRVGRRGAFLGTFGIVYILLGVGMLGRPVEPDEAALYSGALHVMSFTGWGVAAILAGTIALAGAVLRRWRLDAAGYAALQAIAVGWAAAMTASAVAGAPAMAIRTAVVWATLAVAIGIVSGWPEPTR